MKYTYPTYQRYPIEPVTGTGSYLTDRDQKTYLDFTSGIAVCNLGYQNELLQQQMHQQVDQLWHISNLYENQLQDEVAHLLVQETEKMVFFCNSGTEANEAAIKLARRVTGRTQILACTNSFHGRTYGALSATDNAAIKTGFGPFVPEVAFMPYNEAAALDQITDAVAGVLLEVIQGEGGVILGDAAWLQAVQAKCHETGTLLIIDEVQTGMGRTGQLFAYQHYQLAPDVVTVAKALGNGLPIGAVIGRQAYQTAFGPGSHGSTFGGNLLAMTAAKAVLQQITPEFLTTVAAKGQHFITALSQQLGPLPAVKAVRGLGLMAGIELVDAVSAGQIVTQLQKKGLLTLTAKHNTLRLLPPLITKTADLEKGIALITTVLQEVNDESISR
ncbi:acetylornithine transaminase [Agrilactobacillus yilanensis]|uniref:Acetylornithine aminotransferase n=1 Tax=Agrilactobacillus yilanensis TaxID=2485997 RepID=A0ABW4J4V1_9LACO|nr:acetylornithine transaminase [Agrilactobacillus yilanensis]